MTEKNEIDHRPWGMYEVLYSGDICKVKRIVVNPRQRLSLQSHSQRRETWIIVQGTALYQKGEFGLDSATAGDHIIIEKNEKHRIENCGDEELIFIEVQTGEYFGEDDIVRYEDSYGRT